MAPYFCLSLGPQTPQRRPSLLESEELQPQGQSGSGLEGSFLMSSEGTLLVSSPGYDSFAVRVWALRLEKGLGLRGNARVPGPQQSLQLRLPWAGGA